MSSLRRLQHVDRKDIYTNLEARIQYLQSFLDFNSADIQALTIGFKYIRPELPGIVQKIYTKLLQYDITAASFTNASTSYNGPLDTTPSPSSPQIAYRKLFMRGYLQNLMSDPTKPDYWAYLDKVGMMHTRQGRGRGMGLGKGGLDVEYVHIGACLGFIQECLNEAILLHPRLKLERKIAIVKAMGKVLWIQNDLFAKWYVKDGEEFRGEQRVGVEDEGYFSGKKMLRTEFEDGVGSVSPSEVGTPTDEMGRCPFSGMMERMEGVGLKSGS